MTNSHSGHRAVVLLSGGLDSVTALAMALEAGHECFALSVDYGQLYNAELDAARDIGRALKVTGHKVVQVDLSAIGGSALTEAGVAIPEQESTGIPITYVPARNTVMLSLALGYAETLEAGRIYIGANAVDYSGYPDCRPEFIKAFERLANVATKAAVEGQTMRIEAPLIDMSKAEIIRTGLNLGIDYALTVSCYQANDQRAACGVCDSCRLRRQGFEDAGVDDPTRYQ